jgi:hypothetical protein
MDKTVLTQHKSEDGMHRIVIYGIFWLMISLLPCRAQGADTRGLWMLPRMDSTNKARSDIAGNMKTEPREVWRMATGGEVGYARAVTLPGGKEAALILAGTNLEVTAWNGITVWRHTQEDARQIMHVGDFDGDGSQEVMALCSSRRVSLYELATGKKRWSWEAPPSSVIIRSQFLKTPSGIRFITFPTYSVKGFCFDFSGSLDRPALIWEHDYSGIYTTGYGPSTILKDMNSDGAPEIVLASKYCEQGERKTSYHAVIDIDTGGILYDVQADPDRASPVDLGRPYGLLKAVDLDGDRLPEVVVASCQVEEYIELSRNTAGKGLEQMWGKFIEKDWPVDDRELRPGAFRFERVENCGYRSAKGIRHRESFADGDVFLGLPRYHRRRNSRNYRQRRDKTHTGAGRDALGDKRHIA